MFNLDDLFTPEEINARKAEKIGPILDEANRALHESTELVNTHQQALAEAQQKQSEAQDRVNALNAEHNTLANG